MNFTMSYRISAYAALKHQIRDALRTQHPEWIGASGECPQCDEYEERLNELLETVKLNEPAAAQEGSSPFVIQQELVGHESVLDSD